MDYQTFGNVTDLSFTELEAVNSNDSLPVSGQGALLVIEDVPCQYPGGPGLTSWTTRLLLDQDGNIVARSENGQCELTVFMKLGRMAEDDWEKAKEDAIRRYVWSSPEGSRMSDETEAGRRFNEIAEIADRIVVGDVASQKASSDEDLLGSKVLAKVVRPKRKAVGE